jgi:aspartyl-tRNA(Asn)/glutamyl-tRNA(Gln) amidotransferase subunit B
MNSFSAIERALAYEVTRQTKILDGGGKVMQETLLWNEAGGQTESMRSKEEAHDYRYFPEPDLPLLYVDKEWVAMIKAHLPELPLEKSARFVKEFGIPEYDANVLTQDKALANYYETAIKAFNAPKKISNWLMTELLRELKNAGIEINACKIRPEALARLVEMVETNVISGKIGKTVFEEMFATGAPPEDIVKAKGLVQVTDTGEIERIIDDVLADNADTVAKYKGGKTGVFGHLVGEVMKATKGKANPKSVNEILKRKLCK